MNDDLNLIKKYYGENMMHLCRSLFPTILEKNGLLFKLIDSNFQHSRFLYDDIINSNMKDKFKNYIYSLIDEDKNEVKSLKNPFELMREVGYTLYECNCKEDIMKFKKYFDKDEALCTFRQNRLSTDYVFFAVKDNADLLDREDFKHPERQDEYGISVISIQFTKGEVNTLSIKNRYNHTVENCDSTYSNNLENIIPGLTDSFQKEYGFHIYQNGGYGFELPNYVKINDGKFYRYNNEVNNKYYCPNNLIIDHFDVVNDYSEKEKVIVMDYFILDLENKNIYFYDKNIKDGFIDDFVEMTIDGPKSLISKIEVIRDRDNGNKNIKILLIDDKDIYITIDKYNRIISYKNKYNKSLNNGFLKYNKVLSELDTENVVFVYDDVLRLNRELEYVNLPKCGFVGRNFCYMNKKISKIYMPFVEKIGDGFLKMNNKVKEIIFKYLKSVGNYFMYSLEDIETCDLESLEESGNYMFYNLKDKEKVYAPNLNNMGYGYMLGNNRRK